MIFCIMSTFMILLQNGLVMVIARQLGDENDQKFGKILKMIKCRNVDDDVVRRDENLQCEAQNMVNLIDRISFVICFFGFVLFYLVFWLCYG